MEHLKYVYFRHTLSQKQEALDAERAAAAEQKRDGAQAQEELENELAKNALEDAKVQALRLAALPLAAKNFAVHSPHSCWDVTTGVHTPHADTNTP